MARNPPDLGPPEAVLGVVFGCRSEDVAEDVIVTPFVPLTAFRRHVSAEVTELSPPFFYRGFTGTFAGRRVTVLLTGVGPSRVGDCLSFLALTPGRRVLFAGAVGGLSPDHAIGDWFLPTVAADGEGYSRYRDGDFEEAVRGARSISCAGGLEPDLAAYLRGRGLTVREGRVFTIGAVAFESRENLELLARSGFDALEMELSAFYAAAAHHGFQAAALTYVSDLPLRSSLWAPKSPQAEEALRATWRVLPRLALGFLASGD
jgi:purine-nucleoside phosphorylase